MASRRRRGKADESEGEETFEAPAKPGEESGSEGEESYSDEDDEEYDEDEYDEDEEGEEGEGADGEYTLETPVPAQKAESTPVAPTNLAAKESEGQQDDEEGGEGEGGEGDGEVPPPPEAEKEKEKDPTHVPTIGRFFMHDDRAGGSKRQGYLLKHCFFFTKNIYIILNYILN